jgi:hypothetical protein
MAKRRFVTARAFAGLRPPASRRRAIVPESKAGVSTGYRQCHVMEHEHYGGVRLCDTMIA